MVNFVHTEFEGLGKQVEMLSRWWVVCLEFGRSGRV